MPSPLIGLEVDEALRPIPRLSTSTSTPAVFGAGAGGRVSETPPRPSRSAPIAPGNAVVIGAEGLVLTIGYLVTEADEVIVTTGDGRRIPAHVLGVDQATGFGLVQALEPLDLPAAAHRRLAASWAGVAR